MKTPNTPIAAPNMENEKKGFLIAGIGASAGGVQALQNLFRKVTSNSGIAYVVILHLSPTHESQLSSILQNVSSIPVIAATERIKIEPDHIYVVSPNKSLRMEDGHMSVKDIQNVEERRAPIDIFFRTLAESHRERAIAVILSGTGADGSMGLKRVKERGGTVFVQDPEEAEYADMPHNAIATNLVDEVLIVADMAQKIASFKQSLSELILPAETDVLEDDQQAALREIFTLLRSRTGHDFSNYKRATVLRRVERRIHLHEVDSIAEYASLLRHTPEETQALLKDLLISVTNFFRDKEYFANLELEVIPKIIEKRRAEEPIRIWVAGCATGEEAYSIAILFAEQIRLLRNPLLIQIFATDIDTDALARARNGFYTLNDAADVPPERLRQFFLPENGGFRVVRELREMVLFADHNVIKDPPFSRLDMITCRNMLIYFNQSAQNRIMETFHFALKPGGFLFLGSSENVDGSSNLFAPYSKNFQVFQSREASFRTIHKLDISLPSLRLAPIEKDSSLIRMTGEQTGNLAERVSYSNLHQRLLEQYAPPSIVVNETYELVHLSESAGRFLQVPGGKPSKDILQLIKPELRLELRTALYGTVQKKANVEVKNLAVNTGKGVENINLVLRPVLSPADTTRGFILILFEPATDIQKEDRVQLSLENEEALSLQLEGELINIKAQLKNSNQQFEVQTEDLKASNEELQAMNEELRSVAEELETSKEELESLNEELITVNHELKIKVEELSQSNNDFQNLINSLDIGTLFLDRQLKVRFFTPAVRDLFRIIQADIGRPLSDITSQIDFAELSSAAELVLQKLQNVSQEVITKGGRIYLMELQPYRTADDYISGVVVTFINVTQRKQAEYNVYDSEERLRLAVEAGGIGTSDWNFATGKMKWNEKRFRLLGLEPRQQDMLLKDWYDVIHPDDYEHLQNSLPKNLLTNGKQVEEYRAVHPDGSIHWLVETFFVVDRQNNIPFRVISVLFDITDQREAQDKLSKSEVQYRSFVTTSTNFLYRMSTDWEEMKNLDGENFLAETESESGKWMDRFVPPEEQPKVKAAIADVLRNKSNFDLEHQVYLIDGSIGWVHSRATPIFDQAGAITEWFGAASDITARRRAEEQLRESEKKYYSLFNALDEGYSVVEVVFNENGKPTDYIFLDINDAFEQQTGLENAIGKRVRDLVPQYEQYWFDIFGEIAITGKPQRFKREAKALGKFYDVYAFKVGKPEERFVAVKFNDISESIRMTEMIRSSEERLRLATEAARMYSWEYDLQTERYQFSQNAPSILGIEPDTLPKTIEDTFQLIYPEDKEVLQKTLSTTIETGEPFSVDIRSQKKDGDIVWLSVQSAVIKNEEGVPQRIIGIAQDVSSRKQASQALHDNEERYRIALEAGELATWDWNVVTNKVNWNEQHYRLFGVRHKEESIVPEYFLEFVYPEDVAYVKEELGKVLGEVGIYSAEFRVRRRDNGKLRWMNGYGRVTERDEDNKPLRVSGVMFDSTERREAEDKLEATRNSLNTALEAASMGVWNMDLEMSYVDRSPKHDELLGYISWQEEWNLEKAKRNILEEDKIKFDAAYATLLKDGIFQLEARVKHSDGSICWVYYYGRAFKGEDGKNEGAAGVIFDITDRKTMDNQKDEFIGIASHELKTPVTSIKAYAEILQEMFTEANDYASAELMSKLDGQVNKLTKLIKDLLDVTKVSEGQLHLTTEPFNIEEMIRESVEEMQRTTRQHHLQLTLSSLPEIVGDKERIGQVLTNLISNAIKYSLTATEIVVAAKVEEGKLNISVQDFGIGMSPGSMSRLFERFYRSDNPNVRSYPGLGLGLFISMAIMKRLNGTIAVQSERGVGSIFTMILPLR